MIEIEDNRNPVRLHDILSLCERIYDSLEKRNEVSLIEYEAYKKVTQDMQSLTNDERVAQGSMILDKIRALIENITKVIHNKREMDFISDYFISDTSNNRTHEWVQPSEQTKAKAKTDFSGIPKMDLSDKQFACEALMLVSAEYLKDKLNLDEECIKEILGKDYQNVIKHNNLANEQEENRPLVTKKNKAVQPIVIKKDPEVNKQVRTLEKEIQEEINNDILKHTRDLKEYAKKFNADLQKDLVTLDGIEQIQNVGKSKTDKQLKNLTQFNYSLKIGFWKMLLMILTVITTFLVCLFIIRFFPKIVK